MIDMLADAMTRAGSADPTAVARALEGMKFDNGFHASTMRADDHQLIQPLYVMEMDQARVRPACTSTTRAPATAFARLLALPPEQDRPADDLQHGPSVALGRFGQRSTGKRAVL